jgi:hypothetical protein
MCDPVHVFVYLYVCIQIYGICVCIYVSIYVGKYACYVQYIDGSVYIFRASLNVCAYVRRCICRHYIHVFTYVFIRIFLFFYTWYQMSLSVALYSRSSAVKTSRNFRLPGLT